MKPQEAGESADAPSSDSLKPFFSYTMPRFYPYDPTRYNEGQKVQSEFSMTIKEDCQDVPFEVVFDKKSKTDFFDLHELPEEHVPEE